jgi:hypothetical protein
MARTIPAAGGKGRAKNLRSLAKRAEILPRSCDCLRIMDKPAHPYAALPPRAFWRTGVAEAGAHGLTDIWRSPWTLPSDARFATFGSCFAQHISRALKARRMGWIDAEPAPAGTPPALAARFNYGVFSARTANIYTAAQLHFLLALAAGDWDPAWPAFWEDGGRVRDSLRPAIEPDGFANHAEALASRLSMLRALRRAVEEADVFVFTLGLTERWEDAETGQPLAACPGTLGGTFDPTRHRFVNDRAAAVRADMEAALALLQRMNPGIRLLLTVSPVPLTATAAGRHVLVSTTQSKSVLRSVAGEMAEDHAAVDYFPSYEVIAGPQARAGFYAPNLREVVLPGVEVVMGHFFAGLNLTGPPAHGRDTAAAAADAAADAALAAEALACEEAMLEVYGHDP